MKYTKIYLLLSVSLTNDIGIWESQLIFPTISIFYFTQYDFLDFYMINYFSNEYLRVPHAIPRVNLYMNTKCIFVNVQFCLNLSAEEAEKWTTTKDVMTDGKWNMIFKISFY